jgi:hypothetical protein
MATIIRNRSALGKLATFAAIPSRFIAREQLSRNVRFTPTADIADGDRHVRFVPKADIG